MPRTARWAWASHLSASWSANVTLLYLRISTKAPTYMNSRMGSVAITNTS